MRRSFVVTGMVTSILLSMLSPSPMLSQRQAAARPDSSRRDTTRAEGADSAAGRGFAGALSALLKPRLIGPAVTGGRISSIAVHPHNPGIMYIGVASGGVFKTDNGGATFTPIFDRQSSYSIGTVVVDPRNPNTVWVGTGENNSQRSVAYGDGVYKLGRRRQVLEAHGPQEVGAHRPHPRRSAQQRHRVRGRAGAAVGRRRRARPLQDHRRRQDVGPVAHRSANTPGSPTS